MSIRGRHAVDRRVHAPVHEALDVVLDGTGKSICGCRSPGLEFVDVGTSCPSRQRDAVLECPEKGLDILVLWITPLVCPEGMFEGPRDEILDGRQHRTGFSGYAAGQKDKLKDLDDGLGLLLVDPEII